MSNQKKLFFITTRLFWPTNSGRKVSLYHYCKGLHERYGYDIYLYSFLEKGQSKKNIESKPDFIKKVYIFKPITFAEKTVNLLFKSFGKKQWPLQCSMFFSKKNCSCIRTYCNKIKPDVIMTDMIRTAPYILAFQDLSCKKILDMDDLLSKRYRRQLNSDFLKANVVGQYGKEMPSILNKAINGKMIRNRLLSMESKRLEKTELQYASQYDSVIFVSDNETNYVNRNIGIRKAFTVTMGVDYDYYSQSMVTEKETNSLSFVGNMNVAANIDTLHMIADNILPKIKHKVVLKIIGACPNSLKLEYANRTDIEFCGQVDDLRQFVCSTKIFLAPIAYGSGIKTKILEAMAMGMPVITNSVGAEGIVADNNIHFLVSDDFNQISKMVDHLLEDKILCDQISKQARLLVRDSYTWDIIWDKFSELGL